MSCLNVESTVQENLKSESLEEKVTESLQRETETEHVDETEQNISTLKRDPAILEAHVRTEQSNLNNILMNNERIDFDSSSVSSRSISSLSPLHDFGSVVGTYRDALLTLNPNQYDLLMRYVDILRQQRIFQQKALECAFCKKNGESPSWYGAHILKDGRGRVQCPVLQAYVCPLCGVTGVRAHTIKYCPEYGAYMESSMQM